MRFRRANLGPWVQEALDAIQYANGDTNTTWGAQRAANGHPAPFNLQYIEIGNENNGASYNANYARVLQCHQIQLPGHAHHRRFVGHHSYIGPGGNVG